MRMLMTLVLVLVLAGSAFGQGSTEADFEGTNNGDWTFGNSNESIEATGGNPGGWLHNWDVFSFAPRPRCEWEADGWSGDFVASGVSRIAVDTQCITGGNGNMHYYPFTVMLTNNAGTPDDPVDDIYVYYNPDLNYSPGEGTGWTHYEFPVPSGFAGGPGELPADWMGGSAVTGGAIFPSDVTWEDVLRNVNRVEFWYWHPDWAGNFAQFDMGLDNIVIEWIGGTVPNDDSTWGDVKAMFR